MIKDPTVAEVLTEQAQRLRRRVQTHFVPLPLPEATLWPSLKQVVNTHMRIPNSYYYGAAAFAALMVLCSGYWVIAWFSVSSSTQTRVSACQQGAEGIPLMFPPTTAPAPTSAPAAAPQQAQLPQNTPRAADTDPCHVYLQQRYTDNTTWGCGAVDLAEKIVCLAPAVAQTSYGGQRFWRMPTIYHTGHTRAEVSARLAQCPHGPVAATVRLPYSVIYLDADDAKHSMTVQSDACLQLLIRVLSGDSLC